MQKICIAFDLEDFDKYVKKNLEIKTIVIRPLHLMLMKFLPLLRMKIQIFYCFLAVWMDLGGPASGYHLWIWFGKFVRSPHAESLWLL